ncbi:MAG: sensor domain-containing diguanylate cyclase, partial [Acidobacteriota bacterium]|nr:sensor domain-containing diguanylate cyclase [Acidobacteriota bacterium]
ANLLLAGIAEAPQFFLQLDIGGAQVRPHEPCQLKIGDEIQVGKQVLHVGSESTAEKKEKRRLVPGASNIKLQEELGSFRDACEQKIRELTGATGQSQELSSTLDEELKKLQGFLESKLHEYEVLQEISQIIGGILDVKKLLATALELVSDALGADRGFIILYDARHGELRSMIPRHFNREDNTAREYDFTFSQTIARSCFDNQSIIIIEDALEDERFSSAHSIVASSIRSVVCLPLQKGNETAGVIYLDNLSKPGIFQEHQTEFLKAFSAQTAMALENARLYTQAVTDSLTGLYNRKFINERIFEEMVRARRYERDCSLILLDIDHFKAVNDNHGHGVGDQVIERVADILRENARTSDVVARYGGEEFLMLLTETNLEGARSLAERVRVAVAGGIIPAEGKEIRVTISIGVVGYREDFQNKLAAFVAEADKALYRAKESGRDKVCVAGDS